MILWSIYIDKVATNRMLVLLPGGWPTGWLPIFLTRKWGKDTDFYVEFQHPFLPAEPLGNAGAAIKLFEGSFTFKI